METAEMLRQQLVEQLVRDGFLRARTVQEAFRTVPRHVFLPGVDIRKAYSGEAIITRRSQDGHPLSSSSMPGIVAVMVEQLNVRQGNRILEVGAGTGYNAAILAVLAGRSGEVTTIDIDEDIVRDARSALDAAGFHSVRTVVGDGWLGVSDYAPYDRIEITVGVWDLSPSWVEQLSDHGLLVVPLWLRAGAQVAIAFQKQEEHLKGIDVKPCGFMRLRGPHSGPEDYVPIADWVASIDMIGQKDLEVLHDLLSSEPSREQAPAIPARWFLRLAIEEPQAISLQGRDDWRKHAFGVFLPLARSLALISGGELQSFGSDEARERLEYHLQRARPLDLRRISITAYPTAKWRASASGAWILERPNFVIVLQEPGS